jgi:hypothetical protein
VSLDELGGIEHTFITVVGLDADSISMAVALEGHLGANGVASADGCFMVGPDFAYVHIDKDSPTPATLSRAGRPLGDQGHLVGSDCLTWEEETGLHLVLLVSVIIASRWAGGGGK